jgi:hypothetical protein
MFKAQLLSILLLTFASSAAFAVWTGSPSSVKITIYSVAVSRNADCSGATVVSKFANGQEFDFLQSPTLLNGNLADGTYPCVILQMSDVIKITPATSSDDGKCVAGTEYTQTVCRSGGDQKYTPMTINADNTVTWGDATNCTGNETVPLFLSTTATNSGANVPGAFLQPVTANAAHCSGSVGTACGANIANAFTVAGATTGTFVVNFDNAVDVQDNQCAVEAPIFNFR